MKDLDLGKLRVNRSAQPGAPSGHSATPASSVSARLRDRRVWIGGGIALLLIWMLWPGPAAVQATRVVSAWPSQEFEVLNATGYVVARRQAAVAPKGTGRLEWLGVSEGDEVRAGDVVARLESADVEAAHQAAIANTAVAQAAVVSAEAELEDARRNLSRVQVLFKEQLVSLLNLQDAQSRQSRATSAHASALASREAARAHEAQARSAVEYNTMRAPFDGVVISRAAQVGDVVSSLSAAADAKGAVVTIADMSTLEVDAEVSESSLALIKAGQPCEIMLDAFPDRRYRGEVSVVVPTVNRSSATVTTKVRFLDADDLILPDMSARVAFLSQAVADDRRQPVLAVSPEAIIEHDGRSQVFVIGDDQRLRAVTVEPGALLGGVRAVRGDGLKAGDTVALSSGRLSDGKRVQLIENR